MLYGVVLYYVTKLSNKQAMHRPINCMYELICDSTDVMLSFKTFLGYILQRSKIALMLRIIIPLNFLFCSIHISLYLWKCILNFLCVLIPYYQVPSNTQTLLPGTLKYTTLCPHVYSFELLAWKHFLPSCLAHTLLPTC